jgi:polysaccharide biosynthesis/export protein
MQFMNRTIDMRSNKPTSEMLQDRRTRARQVFIAIISAMALPLILESCAQPGSAPTIDQAAAPTAVTLVAGDVIKLTFPGAPELNQTQKVRTDGKVNLPLIGEVEASGKTVPGLQNELAQRYKSELKTSTVTVTLESSVTRVVISGAVGHPGPLTFERPTTVFQAIMEAGGVNEFGTLRNVHLVRLINGQQQTQILDLRGVTAGQTTKPYYLRDGDVVVVQRTMF